LCFLSVRTAKIVDDNNTCEGERHRLFGEKIQFLMREGRGGGREKPKERERERKKRKGEREIDFER
jgi:hypothetical protein